MIHKMITILCLIKRVLNVDCFCRLDRRLLNTVMQDLPRDAAKILKKQLQLTYNVIRLPGATTEVCLYKTRLIIIPRFPAEYIERTFATVSYRFSDYPDEVFRTRFVNVRGALFSIVYSNYPPWKARHFGEPIIEKVKIHYDVMREVHETEDDFEKSKSIKSKVLSGWLGEWQGKYTISDMTKPTSKKRRKERLKELDIRPPQDYLELLDQTEGMTIESVSILGIEEAYEVDLSSGTYVLMAEIHTPNADVLFLLLKKGARDGQLYTCDHEDMECVACGTSFRKAVESFLPAGKMLG